MLTEAGRTATVLVVHVETWHTLSRIRLMYLKSQFCWLFLQWSVEIVQTCLEDSSPVYEHNGNRKQYKYTQNCFKK